jgi:hypothetical protein
MTALDAGGFIGKIPPDKRSEEMTPVRAAIGERRDSIPISEATLLGVAMAPPGVGVKLTPKQAAQTRQSKGDQMGDS